MSHSIQRISLGIFSIFWVLPVVGSAFGPEVWTDLGLSGGHVQTVAVDPSNPDRIFAGIWFGEGLFRSEDGAATWQALKMEQRYEGEDTFENHGLLALSISPANPNVVWAAHNYWVARSGDGGDTWTHIPNSRVQRDCLNCGGWNDNFRFCYALTSHPTDADTAYLGTAGAWSSYSEGAVYKTVDGGETWEKLNQGVNLDYPVVSLAVDPNTPQVLWAATTSFGFGGVWDGSVYRSTDSGRSWTPIDPKPFTGGGVNTVTPHPSDANVVFVAAGGGVARGLFDGSGWTFSTPIEGCTQAYGLVFAPSDANIVYVGWNTPGSSGGDGLSKVSRSADGGLTWETYTVGADLSSLPKTLAVHPNDPEIIFLGDRSGGVLKSQDHGQTWVPVNMGLNGIVVNDVAVDANDTTHVLAATNGGVFERTGATWQRRLNDNAQSVRFAPGSSHAFYAGLWNDLARTQDGGITWIFSSGVANGWIEDIAIDPVASQTLYIADRSHVRRSTDGGDAFEAVLEGRNQAGENYIMNTLAVDPADHTHIYAGGGNFTSPKVLGDLWESLDGGDTWRRTGLTNVIVNKVAVDPGNADILYAGCGYSGGTIDGPIFKSTDAGATWIPVENGLPLRNIGWREVWAESTTNVHAAGGNYEISHFDGNTLEEVLSGGGQQTVNLEGIFGIDANHIYAVGANGTILNFDGSTWNPMSSGTTDYLYSVWGASPNDLLAVGDGGTILHFDGHAWNVMTSGTTSTLNKVFGTAGDNVYAVGEDGTIVHYNGASWSTMVSPTANDLYSVWAASTDAVFAGGDDTLLFYDGHAWTPMSSGTSYSIRDMWGRAADDVYAVVDYKGLILHYDGTAWTASTIPNTNELAGIWGLPSGILFVADTEGGIYRYDGVQWEVLRPAGSYLRSVTDLAFNRQNPDIVYASTYRAGVFISPNRAGQWLNLGTPVLSVNAISAGSLYAATSGGLYQLTGTGVLAGEVYDQHSISMLEDASVTTDLGVGNRTIDGLYMMVLPAGQYDVFASTDNYELGVADDVTVFGADVTWVDFEMKSVVAQMPTVPKANQPATFGSKGSGSYCFVQTITGPLSPMDGMPWLRWWVAGVVGVLFILFRRRQALFMVSLAAFFLAGFSSPVHSFTIFQQVGVASAPLPVGSGARAQGMGGAFIAVADDATAASWNPAGLIQVEKPEISLVGAYVHRREEFSSDTSPEINNTGNVSTSDINYASATLPFHWHNNLVVSLNYQRLFDFKREFQYQRNLTAPGLDLNQQIRYDQDGYVSAIGIAGAIEITPTVSLGATVNIWTDQMGYDNGWTENYSEVAVGSQAGVPVTINTTIQDRYEEFRGINFNLGLLWDTGQWGTVGVVVKTPFTATIQHRFKFFQTTAYGDPVNTDSATGPITVKEEVDLDMPISYGVGWSRRFRDIFTLGIDIYRTEWGDYSLTNDQGEEFSPIDGRPKGQSNVDATTHVRIGAEYLFLMPHRQMAIPMRAGLFYDPEPSEGSPNDVFGFALGTGLTFQRCSLDLAYQLRWAKNADSGNLIAGSEADITQQTLMASVIYYF